MGLNYGANKMSFFENISIFYIIYCNIKQCKNNKLNNIDTTTTTNINMMSILYCAI